MNKLPKEDLPDTYKGQHTTARIRWVTLETKDSAYIGHLIPGASHSCPTSGSYCTRFNPLMAVDLCGFQYSLPNGGYAVVPIGGEAVGRFITHMTNVRYLGAPVSWCSDCLTMAACEAEMIGQRDYPVKKLLRQLGQALTE